MKYYFYCIIFLLVSCNKTEKIIKIEENGSFSSILKNKSEEQNMLIFIKNDECDVCKEFNKFIELNYANLIASKLPSNTKAYSITINSFKNPNMWLFNVLEAYSFPTVVYIERGMSVKGIFKGGDLYSFDRFLNNLNNRTAINEPRISLNTEQLKRYSLLLKGYIDIKENNIVTKPTFKQVGRINAKGSTFISAMIEGYYYKKNNIFPERITYIKNMLKRSLSDTNSYYISNQKLIEGL